MVDLNLIPRSLERTKSIGSFAKSAGEVIRRGQLLRENRFALNVSIRLAGADEVIGYNVGFDLGFLSAVGVRPREDARITDTMKEFTWFMGRRYKLVDAADHIGYEWTGRAHGSLADALATLAVQRWLEQWLVAE